ncbi:MAG: molybdopterin dinucleotide binding domain-containing protein, partial [Desulfosudaceae bacterium]
SEAMAVLALNILVGNLNKPGGLFLAPVPDYIQWAAPEQDDIAAAGLARPRLGGTDESDSLLPATLAQIINDAAQSPVQALFVCEANPVYALTDTAAVKKAFDRIPLKVSLSTYMDETAAAADYVLPTHSYLERYEDILVTAGLKTPLVELSRPVVKPQFTTRHPGDILIKLAGAVGGTVAQSLPWKNYQACLKETLGSQWKKLNRTGYLQKSDLGIALETLLEGGPGKIDFSLLAKTGGEAIKPAGDEKEYPLLLLPYDSFRITAGWSVGTPPFMIKTVADTVIRKKDVLMEINPNTAARYNLAEGDRVILATPRGEARVRLHLSEGIIPGVAALPRGLGHTAYDAYLADKGVNVNSLLGPAADPVSGVDTAWGIRAKLTKA